MAKRKDITFGIVVPEGISASLNGNEVTMKKGADELKKTVGARVNVKQEGDKIILSVKHAGKDEKRELGSAKSHLKNMVEGLTNGYEYELEICIVHFPMTVTYDKAKNEFIVKNQLGEKCPRVMKVSKKITVEVKAPHITIKSYDLDAAGQTAGDLEKLTRIRNRDRNKFQDGIFITKKPGRSFI